ncbi:MAG: methyl-accepting chemotaxis protein [Planctomycetes bacterium]|nr:methyl-accepting chemotaxis protein [Planctomycetota bacterium]
MDNRTSRCDNCGSHPGGVLEKTAYNQLIALRDVKKRQVETYFGERKGDMGVLVENVGTLRNEAFNKLIAVREIKKNQIESYFKDRLGLLTDVQMNLRFTKGAPAFTEAFAQGLESEAYKQTYEQRFAGLNVFCEIFGFYDVFLMDPQGNVVFTVAKEADWGTNLVSGPLKESGLAEAFERGKSATTFVDFAWYGPSKEPASFVSTPLRDDTGQLVGVAAFQVSLKEINAIMQERAGLGETGESYLIGPDKLMRSDSFLDPENHTVVASFNNPSKGSVDTDAARAVLAGASAAKVILDYNGNPVLSAYTPVEVGGVTWGLLTEIDVAEAFCPKDAQGEYFYKKYAEIYGYYDLFLINPDGYCFYTVAQEADYQTNLVNGKYSSSNLGKLTRQVLANKSFGFADFEPYAPSNGTPAAFIAQPVIFDGKTEIIVALQLPLDAINGIMGVRAGMGETGETYLVGPDKLMRSDSFLDPTNHTVAASFKNPAGGSVDTDAAKAALGGATDAKLITDYNGNPVLSAYAPIDVFGTRWALLAEIDESEALAAVVSMNSTATAAGTKLLTWIGALSAVAAVLVLAFAIYLARSISKPINRVIIGLNDGADQVTDAANQVSMSSQQLAEGASEQASSVEETSSSLEEMAAMTRTNAEHSKKASDLAAQAHKNAEEGDKTMGQLNTAITAIDESSAKISKIIKVIEEIAFQTNLLALNAAVEAARAGEHGKGFAVVAEEVRNLAQRSAAAARDTTGLIEDSVNRAKEGTTVAASATKALRSIVSDVTEVASLLSGITQASGEQAQGVEQINGAVSQIDSTTQANAASAEECAAAAEQLNAQAVNVKSMVDELAGVIGGVASREARPAPQQAPRSRRKGKAPETAPVASQLHPGNAHNLFKEKDLDQTEPADAPAMQKF